MQQLLSEHRKQQRDLQSRITQKKKSASKKTRKGVNEECERLELELKHRQAQELENLGRKDHDSQSDTQPTVEAGKDRVSLEKDDLLDSIAGLSTQDDSNKTTNIESVFGETTPSASDDAQQQQRKPNRQKARLARRAAEQEAATAQAASEAADMPDLKKVERDKMLKEAQKRGLVEKEVAANGHCLYLAVADQMLQQKLSLDPILDDLNQREKDPQTTESSVLDFRRVRAAAASYIASNPDDFEPFLEEPLDVYVTKIRNTGEWGGQLELMALAKIYQIDINVLQADGRLEKIESGNLNEPKEAWLAYYRHGFGLGEHYNSLRKPTQIPSTG